MKLLCVIILAYDLIGGSISRRSAYTDVGSPMANTTLYETLTTFVMVCSSPQGYIAHWVIISILKVRLFDLMLHMAGN